MQRKREDDLSTMDPPYLKPGTLIVGGRRKPSHHPQGTVDWEEPEDEVYWEGVGRYSREWYAGKDSLDMLRTAY